MAIDLTCAAEGYSVHRAMQETGVAPTCRTGVQDDTFVILGSQGRADTSRGWSLSNVAGQTSKQQQGSCRAAPLNHHAETQPKPHGF